MRWKRDLDHVIIGALLLMGLYTVVSGAIADRFGFPRFLYHGLAGYACAVLGAIHLTLNRQRVKSFVRQRLARGRPGRDDHPQAAARQERGPVSEETAAILGRRMPPLSRRTLISSAVSAAAGFAVGWLLPRRRAHEFPTDGLDMGAAYHEWSMPGSSWAPGTGQDWGDRPDPFKAYPGAERIALPPPGGWNSLSTEAAIEARRSIRTYSAGSLSLHSLSRVLHAACGVTDASREFRAAPSAGALYPIELYAVVHDVVGLTPGLYHYLPSDHALERLRVGDLRAAMIVAGIAQEMVGRSQVCLVLSAVFQRTRWRYRERAYRYILLEAGHIAQNVYLAATSLGLGACAIGAFLDGELNQVLGLDGRDEASLYILTVGQV